MSRTLEENVWRAWNRDGAREAAQVLLLHTQDDSIRALELLGTLDMLPHVRDGIATYLGGPLDDLNG